MDRMTLIDNSNGHLEIPPVHDRCHVVVTTISGQCDFNLKQFPFQYVTDALLLLFKNDN